MILSILIGSRTLAHRDATNNLCILQVFFIDHGITQPPRDGGPPGPAPHHYHYNDLSQQYFIVCGITQPRNHTHANQTVQTALQHIRALGYE